METIKYEAVFGDQSLFTQDETEIIYKCDKGSITETSLKFLGKSIDNGGIIAMRRIIKTPVWTVADQKAGRLPDVGAKYLAGSGRQEFTCLFHGKGNVSISVIGFNADNEVMGYLPEYCYPIETPEDRAQRLRDEWAYKAFLLYAWSQDNGVDSMRYIYDAMLSGELQSPKDIK